MLVNEHKDGRGWKLAVELVKEYNANPVKCDILLGKLPDDISSHSRSLCQFLFLGVIRHKKLIDGLIAKFTKKPPKPSVLACMELGIAEIIEEKEPAKVINYVVDQVKSSFSQPEANFVNAVLRKVAQEFRKMLSIEKCDTKWLSLRYSHPEWLVKRWLKEFGMEALVDLLRWNQSKAHIYFRGKGLDLKQSPWENFYEVVKGDWGKIGKLLTEGSVYIQDPSTRIAPTLLEVGADDKILDLCAAPGGKARFIGEQLGPKGSLVALDLPGKRIGLLKENLSRLKDLNFKIIEMDLKDASSEAFEAHGLPGQYNGVLLDAPCSNTGVIGRRPDVKWRLAKKDIDNMATLQLELLKKASTLVVPGGKLVYSTCSIEREENEAVVEQFIKENAQVFELIKGERYFPWSSGHDGGGAFLFEKKA